MLSAFIIVQTVVVVVVVVVDVVVVVVVVIVVASGVLVDVVVAVVVVVVVVGVRPCGCFVLLTWPNAAVRQCESRTQQLVGALRCMPMGPCGFHRVVTCSSCKHFR